MERPSAALAFDHLQWLANERKCSANYELFTLRALVAAAKFCHGGDDAENDGFAKPYADVPLVGQLRKISKGASCPSRAPDPVRFPRDRGLSLPAVDVDSLRPSPLAFNPDAHTSTPAFQLQLTPMNSTPMFARMERRPSETMKRADRATPTSDARKKWLAWDQFVAVVDRLREECAPRLASGAKRPARAVAWAYQRYLILGMLSCVPDRGVRSFRTGSHTTASAW